MCGLKCGIRVVVIALIIQSGQLISSGTNNGTAEILWNLSQLAVQSRQSFNSPKQFPTESQLHPEKFSKYTGPIKSSLSSRGQYGLVQNYQNHYRPQQNIQRPNPYIQRPNPYIQRPNPYIQRPNPYIQRPNPYVQLPHPPYPIGVPRPIPALPPGYQEYQQGLGYPQQSFTEALQSIARNDNLRCVSRLLCELTSGPSSGQRQESILPFNLNMESLIGLLSAVSGSQTSGLLEFGKAALLGYTSKGNTRSCLYAYPQCPQDPDRLVDYLNNYNGGFFRFFNGLAQNPQRPLFPQLSYPPRPVPPYYPYYRPQNTNYYTNRGAVAEKRILTKPIDNLDSINLYQNGIKFPDGLDNGVAFQSESLVFPQEDNLDPYEQNSIREYNSRRQKTITFPSSDFEGFDFPLQGPLPNINQVKMIFPDRTGTGELRLDADELNINYNRERPHYLPERYEDRFGPNSYFTNRNVKFL